MAPEPFRGEQAHPGFIPLIGSCIANLHGVSLDEVLSKTFENTNKIYNCFYDCLFMHNVNHV
jgi:Tat protein secretion system quality control protein TatD with DNase activity